MFRPGRYENLTPKQRENQKKYREKHKDKIKKKKQDYYVQNREEILSQQKQYRETYRY